MTNEQYLQIAKEYALENKYTHIREVERENSGVIFNLYNPRDVGTKKGLPFFIEISLNGSIQEIEDASTIYYLQERLIEVALQSE